MIPPAQPSESYIDAVGLQARMRQRGINRHYDYWRALIRDCPHSVRAEWILFSDAWSWWILSVDWRPFAKGDKNSPPVGGTASLSAQFGAAPLASSE